MYEPEGKGNEAVVEVRSQAILCVYTHRQIERHFYFLA